METTHTMTRCKVKLFLGGKSRTMFKVTCSCGFVTEPYYSSMTALEAYRQHTTVKPS